MSRTQRDFEARPADEQEWMLKNTWCDACGEADLGMSSPHEYDENGRVYVEEQWRWSFIVRMLMTIGSHLKKQIEIARWINGHLTRPFSVDRKRQLALACFDLAIEHHGGICLLCTSELYGPMYALLRVEFEALGRGLWLSHVAKDEDADKYEKDELDIGFGTLLNLVESQVGLPNGPLSTLKSKHWSIFCSFTHTGYQALVRRVTQTHTGPINYPAEEVISALSLAGTFALLAAAQLSSMTGDHDLVNTTLAKAREYAS